MIHLKKKKKKKAGDTRGKETRATDKQVSNSPYGISSPIWGLEGEYRNGLWKAQRSRKHRELFLVAIRIVQKFS